MSKTAIGRICLIAACLLLALTVFAGCAPPVEEQEPPDPVAVNEWPESEPANDSDFTDDDLIWQEEFNGAALNKEKWRFDTGRGNNGWGNNEAQYYREENARVSGGKLQIIAREEAYQTARYTSAKVLTDGRFSMKYGRVEARVKLPVGEGFWPAFWMMPQASVYGAWPRSGEIDIMEAKGRLEKQTSSAIHYGMPLAYKTYTKYLPMNGDKTIASWRTYGLEWRPGELKFLIDGELSVRYAVNEGENKQDWFSFDDRGNGTGGARLESGAPFDQEFFVILNFAVGGHFDGGILPPGAAFAPAVMEIDWVRAYRLSGLQEALTYTVNGTQYGWDKQEIV
ncbi:MAG: glycoside hydrolase family 16 protein [Clostridiales bacterium]|nr:glycoside hydrolase family 16 protein [Clostridiales bacterium]